MPRLRSLLPILAVMAVAGWPSLSMPFRGDEALFAVVAEELANGSVLYRDYWDVTNPGIFWFYQLAGTLFGFTEEGIRLLEWLWLTAFVLAVSEASRRAIGMTRWPLAPALLIGVPYFLAGYSQPGTLTKTEGLVPFPLFLSVWFAARASDAGRWRIPLLVAAGAAGGVVVLFKLLLGGCVAVAWLYLWVEAVRGRPRKVSAALTFAAGIAGGLAAVLSAAVAHFAAHDSLGVLIRTVFELPPQFLAEGDRAGLDRLAVSAKWFLGQFTPVLVASVLGVGLRTRRDPFVVALVLVLAASVAALLVQRLSWWPYHFLLPGALAGVLAAYRWPAVLDSARGLLNRSLAFRERFAIVAAVGVLWLEPLGAGGYQFARLAGQGMGLSGEHRRAFRESLGTAYREALDETAWLRDAEPGPVFVCGDPLFYWLSGRKPAARISGWSLEIYPRAVRSELADEVRPARPNYVYVSTHPHGYDRLLRDRYPELVRLLETDYVPVRGNRLGVWYARAGR